MVYGGQQWSSLMKMDADELSLAYHCATLIKKAENEAAKEAVEKAKAETGGR